MTFNFLITGELLARSSIVNGALLPWFESNDDIFHLLLDGIRPEGRASFFINAQGFVNRLGQADAKFMSGNPIAALHLTDDAVALSKGMRNPPTKMFAAVRAVLVLVRSTKYIS